MTVRLTYKDMYSVGTFLTTISRQTWVSVLDSQS